ncbi:MULTISPECIES: outer membrane lipoprotein-sorting protein [unclassified Marinimicrobium]|uniref:outer membrane lipoprotein-sorting protein n=1 Tax=Marinimicrobium TaxID=359337 RepID=UPI00257B0BF3|nr:MULTISPECIES: outer membrane lipoprotein-sorting protein [unclassified Marinimicrobium]
MMNIKTVLATAALTLFAVGAQADEALTDPREIVRKAERVAFYSGDDGRSEARMLITDNQGRRQVRQFTILRKTRDDNQTQDMMVFFSRPADVRNTVFRVIKRTETDDDRWLYLPGLDLVKRISAGDKRTSFVGSHFFYEDVSGRSTDLDDYELLETTDEHYRLRGTAKDPSEVEFSHYEVTIDRETLLPVGTDYYNDRGEVYRQMEVKKIETIEGYPTVVHSIMRDLDTGGETEMQFRNVRYDLGIPENIFSERSLRNPPTDWLN